MSFHDPAITLSYSATKPITFAVVILLSNFFYRIILDSKYACKSSMGMKLEYDSSTFSRELMHRLKIVLMPRTNVDVHFIFPLNLLARKNFDFAKFIFKMIILICNLDRKRSIRVAFPAPAKIKRFVDSSDLILMR